MSIKKSQPPVINKSIAMPEKTIKITDLPMPLPKSYIWAVDPKPKVDNTIVPSKKMEPMKQVDNNPQHKPTVEDSVLRMDDSVFRANVSTISTINSTIHGDNNTIIGNFNTISGSNNVIRGNNNVNLSGSNNTYYGCNNVIKDGKNCVILHGFDKLDASLLPQIALNIKRCMFTAVSPQAPILLKAPIPLQTSVPLLKQLTDQESIPVTVVNTDESNAEPINNRSNRPANPLATAIKSSIVSNYLDKNQQFVMDKLLQLNRGNLSIEESTAIKNEYIDRYYMTAKLEAVRSLKNTDKENSPKLQINEIIALGEGCNAALNGSHYSVYTPLGARIITNGNIYHYASNNTRVVWDMKNYKQIAGPLPIFAEGYLENNEMRRLISSLDIEEYSRSISLESGCFFTCKSIRIKRTQENLKRMRGELDQSERGEKPNAKEPKREEEKVEQANPNVISIEKSKPKEPSENSDTMTFSLAEEDNPEYLDNHKCIICEDKGVSVIYMPCGHAKLCDECSKDYLAKQEQKLCPTCRQEIKETFKIFL